MRSGCLTVACIIISITCVGQINNHHGLIGRWQLVETNIDPGDGSGKWEPAKTDFVLKIRPDSTVKTTGTGAYAFKHDSTFIVKSDGKNGLVFQSNYRMETVHVIRYDVKEKSLVFVYACIEGCRERFKAIK